MCHWVWDVLHLKQNSDDLDDQPSLTTSNLDRVPDDYSLARNGSPTGLGSLLII